MKAKPRLLRITTVPVSLNLLLNGQFVFFQQRGFEVLTASADGPEVLQLSKTGVQHQVVPMTRKITPLQDLYCLFRLIRMIRKFNPHIVHTHTPKAGLLGMMAAWFCRVPVRMHTVAGLPLMEAKGLKRWLLNITEKITYACAHQVYPNSKGLLNYIFSELGIQNLPPGKRGSKFKIIGNGSTNGIDSSFFFRNDDLAQGAKEIRDQYNIPQDAVVFSFVGRLVKDKGIVELVQAFQEICESLNSRLILVGPFEEELDPLPEEILAFVRSNNRVIITGFQQEVRTWMAASDVFVFPSYREGFPNVVMQAACLEVPCIVSDINGCNEIIQHDETGICVPVKDSSSLLRAMIVLAEDRMKRTIFGQKSRAFVVKNFDRQQVWESLLKEYSTALETRK